MVLHISVKINATKLRVLKGFIAAQNGKLSTMSEIVEKFKKPYWKATKKAATYGCDLCF
jgi:hypothetical protein